MRQWHQTQALEGHPCQLAGDSRRDVIEANREHNVKISAKRLCGTTKSFKMLLK